MARLTGGLRVFIFQDKFGQSVMIERYLLPTLGMMTILTPRINRTIMNVIN